MDDFDLEEKRLTELVNSGSIDESEYDRRMSELYRAYRDDAERASGEAYDQEMERW